MADGETLYNHATDYIANVTWPLGHNFTFGGRELHYTGEALNGYMTDVQIFNRSLTNQEMFDFTSCQGVRIFRFFAS